MTEITGEASPIEAGAEEASVVGPEAAAPEAGTAEASVPTDDAPDAPAEVVDAGLPVSDAAPEAEPGINTYDGVAVCAVPNNDPSNSVTFYDCSKGAPVYYTIGGVTYYCDDSQPLTSPLPVCPDGTPCTTGSGEHAGHCAQ